MEVIGGLFVLLLFGTFPRWVQVFDALVLDLAVLPKIRAEEAAGPAQVGPEPAWMAPNLMGWGAVVFGGLRPRGKITLDSGVPWDVVREKGFIDADRQAAVGDRDGARLMVCPIAGWA